ncbi:hypothetical protein TJA_23580 [Thermus sp. LT1-2-5]|uniref:hypothetical protein n=1 Tax=Thermus sp. LT1-2-5 TaxID=3026935 RepID=UPI0030E7FA76
MLRWLPWLLGLLLLGLASLLEDLGQSRLRPYLALVGTLLGAIFVRLMAQVGRGVLQRLGQQALYPGVLLLEVLGYLAVAAVGLSLAGYHPAALLAGGAVVGALVGLASQTALASLLYAFLLLFSGAVRVGNAIGFNLGGVYYRGRVQEVTLSHLRLEGPSGTVWVPNAVLFSAPILWDNRLPLQASLPSEKAWRALEEAFPAVRFVPASVDPSGLHGTLYLPREELDAVRDYLQGLASSQAPQG